MKEEYRKLFMEHRDVFRISGDIVEFDTANMASPAIRRIVDTITQCNLVALLTTDADAYTKLLQQKEECNIELSLALVDKKFSTDDQDDVIYGDVLWANVDNSNIVKLVFNWKQYIRVIASDDNKK